MKYITYDKVIKAYCDYDVPSISKKNNKTTIKISDELDYKIKLYILKNNKIYEQKVTFDNDIINIQTKLVYP
jgi:uncharacterized protein (DUF2147 family)